MTAPDAIHLVFVTCPPAQAEALATALVEDGVAACVNLLPQLRSVYRWQGQVQRDDETLLLIKAPASGFGRLKQAILARHPYELPEIVAVHPADGHGPYFDWILSTAS